MGDQAKEILKEADAAQVFTAKEREQLGLMGSVKKAAGRAKEWAGKVGKRAADIVAATGGNPLNLLLMATSEEIDTSLQGIPDAQAREVRRLRNLYHRELTRGRNAQADQALERINELLDQNPRLQEFYDLTMEEVRGEVKPGEASKFKKALKEGVASGEISPALERASRRVEIIGSEKVRVDEEEIEIPVYRDVASVASLLPVIRDYLNEVILSDRNIRHKSLEHQLSYGLVWAVRNLATKEGTPEAKKQANEIVMEYEAVRRALDWWHEAARDDEGGFSKGKDTFANGIDRGGKYMGDYIVWFKESYRGRDFIHGFATPRDTLANTDFKNAGTNSKNASEFLGAMLRSSCGVGTKDEVSEPGKRRPDNEAGTEFMLSDGTRILVINARGEIMARTKGGNAFMYETHKQVSEDLYSFKYLEVRHKFQDAAFEFSHMDKKTGMPVYICHISADRLLAYDAFQHPKFMANFWYGNIDVLLSAEVNAASIPEGQRGRDFLRQLGWRDDLDPTSITNNNRLNRILLGTGNNFLSGNVTPAERRTLAGALGVRWNEALDREEKIDLMERMGMVRRFGDRTWGMKENYLLTQRLITLDTEKIPEEIWLRTDWSTIRRLRGAFLGDWSQQMVYLQQTRNSQIDILKGDEGMMKGLEFLGSENGWRHIPDILSQVAEREQNQWFEALSDMLILQPYMHRMKGQRVDEVAVPTNQLLRLGVYAGTYAQEFVDVGQEGHNWRGMYEHPIRRHEGRVAKILGKSGRRELWENHLKGFLTPPEDLSKVDPKEAALWRKISNLKEREKWGSEQEWKALIAFARFKIRPNKEGNEEGYWELKEVIKHPGRMEQKGRLVHYYDFDLDRDREWGRETFEGLGFNEQEFNSLMALMNLRIQQSGLFNRFYEKQDEENILYQLIDRWSDEIYTNRPENVTEKDWGVQISFYKKEILVNQAVRDLKYSIGKFRGDHVSEQLATNPNDKLIEIREINGEEVPFEVENVELEESPIKGLKNEIVGTTWQPIFPMFHRGFQFSNCRDKVWGMLGGTGEWFPGMDKRLTPLYIHYNRDRYMSLFAMIVADPLFRLKAYENSGKTWEGDQGYLFVANPLKLKQLIDKIDSLESDPNWAQKWRARLNIAGAKEINEFDRHCREIGVLYVERKQAVKAESEEDIKQFQTISTEALNIIEQGPLKGIVSKPLGALLGGAKSTKEIYQRALATLPSGLAVNIAAVPFTGGFMPFQAAQVVAGAIQVPILGPLAGVAAGAFVFYVTGLPSLALLGGDAGINPTTLYESEAFDDSTLGTIRRGWKNLPISGSLMKARIEARSYESLAKGKSALWDDIVSAGFVDSLFEHSKAKLDHSMKK